MTEPTDTSNALAADGNPYRTPEWQSAADDTTSRKLKWFWIPAVLQCLTIVIGSVAAFVDIESIVASGIIVFALGCFTAAQAIRHRYFTGTLFGLSGPAMALFCFILINARHWSPSDAQRPVSQLILVYACVSLPFGVYSVFSVYERYIGGRPDRSESSLSDEVSK